MVVVTTPLVARAERIFDGLGYTVSTDEGRVLAERKWRTVQVAPPEEADSAATSADLCCFVTDADEAPAVRSRLAGRDLDAEWAVMGLGKDGDYEVHHGPAGGSPA
ncbi:MAG: hypothetical protein ABEJ30_02385 [Halorientalis sp.]